MSGAEKRAETERLILGCQGLVKSLAWKLHRQLPDHVDLDDLVGYGQVGLAQAAQEFDPQRGGQFTTYAYFRVRGAILDGLSQMSWFSRSDFAGGRYVQHRSLDRLADGDDEGCSPQDVEDTGHASPDAAAWCNEQRQRVAAGIAALPEPAQALIRAAYFDGLNLREAGERLGYSRGWACRMHQRALTLLSSSLESC